jgi:hypothetical protein
MTKGVIGVFTGACGMTSGQTTDRNQHVIPKEGVDIGIAEMIEP